MSEKPKPTESQFSTQSKNTKSVPLSNPIDVHLPVGKTGKLKPLFIDVESIEKEVGTSPESVVTLVGSITPQGFSPGHQELKRSEVENTLEEIRVDPEKTPRKPKSPPKSK